MQAHPTPSSMRRLAAGLLIACAVSVGGAAHAFTASNTVPNSRAGDGTSTVSGYTISGVVYNLNATTPTNVNSVSFTIAPTTATTVRAKLAGTWYACVNVAGTVTCATTSPQATVAAIASLEIVAV